MKNNKIKQQLKTMENNELEELKNYIRDCNYVTFISLCEYAYEVSKSYNKQYKPKKPYQIFKERFKEIVLHETKENKDE